jgi:hypothetical protein
MVSPAGQVKAVDLSAKLLDDEQPALGRVPYGTN